MPFYRTRRVRLLALIVVGGALFVACRPAAAPTPGAPGSAPAPAPTPAPAPAPAPAPYQTQYCSGGTPVGAADYQAQHDGLRTVNTDFGAADGGTPVDLGDGRTLWLFADTWTGYIRDGAMVAPYHLVHNAFVVQSGGCLTPILGGSHGARTDVIPAPTGQFYWPMGALVDSTTLYVFAQRFVPGGGLCGCVAQDIEIAKFSLPGLQFLGTSPSPAVGLLPEFGGASVTSVGYRYLYGRSSADGAHRNWHYLARVPVGGDPSAAAWQYWNGGTTGTSADWGVQAASVPMQFDWPNQSPSVDGPNAPLFVIPQPGGGFLASAKPHDVTANTIWTWYSATPYGPWIRPATAALTQSPPGGFTYSGRVFQLPGALPTAQYSTNGPDNERHTDAYKVLFRTSARCSIDTADRDCSH